MTDDIRGIRAITIDDVAGAYPGVVYDQERDVMAEAAKSRAEVFNQADFAEVKPVIDDQALRAASIQAAQSLPTTSITDLLLNAAAVEAYLRDGTVPVVQMGTDEARGPRIAT